MNIAFALFGHDQVSALQVAWPDPQGRFPWEPSFDLKFRGVQPLLEQGLGGWTPHGTG